MKNLFILPFDHRASILRELGVPPGRKPTASEKQRVSRLKEIIFNGFKLALARGVPRASAAILVDAEFGAGILREAKRLRIKIAMPVEKSETQIFELEPDFEKLVDKFKPDFVKALVRFNPALEFKKQNAVQLARLKRLSDFLKKTRREFLLELLVPPTAAQLKKFGKNAFDARIRPELALQAMREIQDYGVEPSVWKIEGVERVEHARSLVKQARAGGRNARIVVLGRGERAEKVKKWLCVCNKAGFDGFAVGRTVFAKALEGFLKKETSAEAAGEKIAENFKRLADFWVERGKLD